MVHGPPARHLCADALEMSRMFLGTILFNVSNHFVGLRMSALASLIAVLLYFAGSLFRHKQSPSSCHVALSIGGRYRA
jgi:hypothetical protein